MSTISAATVKALRDRTNAPMMDCKAALPADQQGIVKPRPPSSGNGPGASAPNPKPTSPVVQ